MDIERKLVVREVIRKLIKSQNYRTVTQTEINAKFLAYCLNFFQKVVEAKLIGSTITADWYKDNFVMNEKIKPEERAIYAGINKKTINNYFNAAPKEIVITASEDNYDSLVESISHLIDRNNDIDLTLNIKFKGISIELNLNESLVVITSLAVKRAAITGGAYSAIGKNVEGPLMLTLCKLFNVPNNHYSMTIDGGSRASYGEFDREIDFFLLNGTNHYKCEVKLMGKGNPEVADAVIARESKIFVADELSDLNINQLTSLGIYWTSLRKESGFLRFEEALKGLGIPYTLPDISRLDVLIDDIFKEIL
jgi:hypothetical protein